MTAPLAFWVHDLDPVAFRFPADWPLGGVHWYGMAYAAGFLLAAWLFGRWRRAGVAPLRDGADESALMTALMVGVVGGGRLGHVLLYAREAFAADPLMVFRVWQGGMASHGGFLGVTLACLWFARTRRTSFLAVGDLVCAATPAGILFGRLANFVNAELVGRPTGVPWAVVFPREGPEPR
ncbi:MAG: prolipoprotein diacylglyceryl transferase, partial [Verrucomicrobiota bacterium]